MEMLTANDIAYKQLEWAVQEKIILKGYAIRTEDNIYTHELHPETLKEHERGKGHELEGKRAHMKAFHSSSALVINVFDYWRRQNRIQDIARCCGAEGTINAMEFEKTHPIKGINRTPPHMDVEFSGLTPLAIESKFTETYHRRTRRDDKDTHLGAYLKHSAIWDRIPKTKAIAEKIHRQSGTMTDYEYLDVPQLIKHVLGLTCSYLGQFSLLYLWYRTNSSEATQHEEELASFSIAIKDEISFQTMTYQDLFNKIRQLPDVDSAYINYLERRYFSVS